MKKLKIMNFNLGAIIILISILTISVSSSNLMTDDQSYSKDEDSLITPKSSGVVVEWTWMMGNKTIDEHGIYGIKGVPDSANYPGSRMQSTSCTDINETLWLFGGMGYPETGADYTLNDFWRYNITSQEWTWMSGNKTTNAYGVYGTKGVPDNENYPGCRFASVSWVDREGDFWLFGGMGNAESDGGHLNDLWRYNITSQEWAWMSGNKTADANGVYGTKGIPDSENYPGRRYDSVSWNDTKGNLWLFGGWGYDELGSSGRLNDVWRFNITSSEWTWMLGNKTVNVNGVYGTKGLPDSANYPGARRYSGFCTDIDGNLWVFGGYGHGETGPAARLNDLWRFNMTSYEWTWMSGSKTTNVNGVYGTKGLPDSTNFPGGRYEPTCWVDTNEDIWAFGGYGFPESGTYDLLNDLWKFDLSSYEWTWMSGSKAVNENGVYGTKGVPDSENYPGARYNSAFWTDADSTFYLFGGSGYPETGASGYLNDLWTFEESYSNDKTETTDDDDNDDETPEKFPIAIIIGIVGVIVSVAVVFVVVMIKKKGRIGTPAQETS